jgi:flavorubredoxin
MSPTFQPVKVTDEVYWVGAIDWSIRDFHGYSTNQGTTYNAFLIMADKVTLIDTVKKPYEKELLARVAQVIDPAKIDYIISNHAEMDHTGSLPSIMAKVKPEKVFASEMGVKVLKKHFGNDFGVTAVEKNGELDLGNMTLQFLETRMLHWPDSMFTYMPHRKLLFSNDAFGMHYATSKRFDDEVDDWYYEAIKYYANILTPYSTLVQKLIEKVVKLGLEFDIIAPDHGPIWRSDPGKIVGLYQKWAEGAVTNKAVVVYDTMWESTAGMAQAVVDGLISKGADVKLMSLKVCHRSDIVTELHDAAAVVVGSPTLNNNILPKVADFLTYLKGLRPKNKVGASFGSYGWSGESVGQIDAYLEEMKVELVNEGLRVKFVPDENELAACFELGKNVAEKMKAKIS